MTIRRFVVPVNTNESGDAQVFSPVLSGKLISFTYVKDDFADGVDFVITSESAGETLWSEEDVNASTSRYPRAATAATDGSAALYAADGEAVNDLIAIADDRVSIVVADGGDTKSGTFHITIDG
jgi:hypothetical protein